MLCSSDRNVSERGDFDWAATIEVVSELAHPQSVTSSPLESNLRGIWSSLMGDSTGEIFPAFEKTV